MSSCIHASSSIHQEEWRMFWLVNLIKLHGIPWLCRAVVVPGVRLRADTPRGPPRLTGLNPTVYWYTNQPTPARRERFLPLPHSESMISFHVFYLVFVLQVCMQICVSHSRRRLRGFNQTTCSSHTPAIFWQTKYSTKEPTASSSLLLGPNPFQRPPQCSAHTSFLPPVFSSKDIFSLAKYTLVIHFQCKQFRDTAQGMLGTLSQKTKQSSHTVWPVTTSLHDSCRVGIISQMQSELGFDQSVEKKKTSLEIENL